MLTIKSDRDLLIDFGHKVKHLRLTFNWTREEMARRSGIPYSTLRRLETTGEGSIRDYLKALRTLGRLNELVDLMKGPPAPLGEPLHVRGKLRTRATGSRIVTGEKTATITIADYPQLQAVAWNRRGDDTCSEADALALYERNWRFIDQEALTPTEKKLIDRLVTTHGNGALLV